MAQGWPGTAALKLLALWLCSMDDICWNWFLGASNHCSGTHHTHSKEPSKGGIANSLNEMGSLKRKC